MSINSVQSTEEYYETMEFFDFISKTTTQYLSISKNSPIKGNSTFFYNTYYPSQFSLDNNCSQMSVITTENINSKIYTYGVYNGALGINWHLNSPNIFEGIQVVKNVQVKTNNGSDIYPHLNCSNFESNSCLSNIYFYTNVIYL